MQGAPKLTYDFVMAQLRIALVAVLAYGGGKGWWTPQDATLLTALGSSLGPVAVPWIWSIIENIGTIRVSTGTAAATVAAIEKTDKPSAAAGATAALKAAASIAVAFVIMSLAWTAPVFAQAPLPLPRIVKPTGNIKADVDNVFGINTPATAQAGQSFIAGFDSSLNKFAAKVQAVEKDLADKVIADLNAAITDATNHNDAISLPCWNANLKFVQQLPAEWATPPSFPIGVALAIQIQRDLLNAITSNDGGSIKVACAALYGDQLAQIGKLGLLFGFTL